MTPESAKKFEALSVGDKAALERYASVMTNKDSAADCIDGFEKLTGEPAGDSIRSMLVIGRSLVKAGIGEPVSAT